MPFKLTLTNGNVSEDKLIEIKTPFSVFYVTTAGRGREPEDNYFFYGDHEIQLMFAGYVDVNSGGSMRVVIDRITDPLSWFDDKIRVNAVIKARLRENLTWLFQHRHFHFPSREMADSETLGEVIFGSDFM